MDAGRFTIILYLLSTMLLINCAMSYDKQQQNESQINNVEDVTTEWMNKAFVATTPRAIKTRDSRSSSEEEDEDEHPIAQARQASNSNSGFNPVTMVFNAVTNALLKSAQNVARKSPSEIFRSSSSEDDEEYYEDDSKGDVGTQEAEAEKKGSSESSIITSNTTSDEVFEGRQANSYIKGDPLNGYYDFVITEGSYKFWVVFQLFTAGLLIYSTLAAIYYSKVNPLTSDYDYVDYLSRSFNGRSMDTADVDDGDADETSTVSSGIRESARTYLSSLEHNKWVRTAAYGFQFAMDAIDRIPQ
ncbi:uncharacterized protein [Chironomus tepperi]|uniref:uncharacterized protein n=1 Tax=Chironomus tepperi TaxID=113505 RepID=UPI00391F89FA